MNVFDFDNTIYRGETGVDLFLFFFKRDPSLVRYLPLALDLIYRYKKGRFTVEEALEVYSPLVEKYLAEKVDISADIQTFWNTHMHKIKPLYFRLRSDDDLILSACPELVLDEICKRMDIRRYIGTGFDLETMRVTSFCFREHKVKAFKEQFPDTRIHNFYTDSFNDKPMMDISDNVFLVKGNQVEKIK